MGSFVRLSAAAAAAAVAAAPVAQSGGGDNDTGLFLPEFSHAFDAVPAVPFAVRATAAAGEEKAHMPAPCRTGTQAPTAVAANIRTLRRIRHMRAALRAQVRACVVSCRATCACVCAHG
jgi:hypothetical protein